MNILFLSAIDFKDKSIQVIRMTPLAYIKAGWKVDYIVGRDECVWGNYHYETVFNPEKVNVIRIKYPFTKLRDHLKIKVIRTLVNKLTLVFLIFKIKSMASVLIKEKSYDMIYGYEIHGVLALLLLKISGKLKGLKTIHRFQGSWLPKYIKDKKYFKVIANLDALIAYRLKADAVIMTDDGTKGDLLFKNREIENFKFWVNGVDKFVSNKPAVARIKKKYGISQQKIIISVSRLEGWKRVDRCIEVVRNLVVNHLYTNFIYIIIGGGTNEKTLKDIVKDYSLEEYIIFTGPIANNEVNNYYEAADVFLSMYDLSNVGNPLLEAIRSHKIIFTLSNGDTPRWIKHKENGYIYEIDKNLYNNAADDLFRVLNSSDEQKYIIDNVEKLEKERLWTWEERLNEEVNLARKIILE